MIASTSVTAAPDENPRWYRPTPERLVWTLLGAEVFLWLSERCCWFPFNEKKGVTVLVALGVLAGSILAFALWFLSALLFRRRFQFTIRTLLAMTLAVALAFSWLAARIDQAKRPKCWSMNWSVNSIAPSVVKSRCAGRIG